MCCPSLCLYFQPVGLLKVQLFQHIRTCYFSYDLVSCKSCKQFLRVGNNCNLKQKTRRVCKQSLPGFLCNVPVDLDVAKFAHANCMTAAQLGLNPLKHTVSPLQLLIVIIWQECGCMWVGCIIWIALGVNQTHPHPQRLPLVGPHCVVMATGQTRGGASVLHLVIPAAQALLWHACSVCLCAQALLSVCLPAAVQTQSSVCTYRGVYSCMLVHILHFFYWSISACALCDLVVT